MEMIIGNTYRWSHQKDVLIYLGKNWSGGGFWHQFEKSDRPGEVWCELLDSDLQYMEEVVDETLH